MSETRIKSTLEVDTRFDPIRSDPNSFTKRIQSPTHLTHIITNEWAIHVPACQPSKASSFAKQILTTQSNKDHDGNINFTIFHHLQTQFRLQNIMTHCQLYIYIYPILPLFTQILPLNQISTTDLKMDLNYQNTPLPHLPLLTPLQ